MVTLNGTYTPPDFTPSNLTWNTNSGTWDTTTHNWLNGATSVAYSQTSGLGDNVTFNNPANNSVVTIQSTGVTPDSITIINNNTLTFTGGSISGAGGLNKSGSGRLIMASSNSFTGISNPTAITGGIVETRANNALGSGPVSIGNAIWNSTTAAQTFGNTVSLTNPVTFDTTTDLTIGGLDGAGTFSKVGNGTLGIAGIGTNTGDITITAGTVRMDNMGALGGNATAGVTPNLTLTNANLIFNGTGNGTTGVRPSANIQLNNSTMTRNQLTPALGPSPTNGDSELSAYPNSQFTGGTFTVTGNSTLTNLETRTAATSDTPGKGGSSNEIVIRMPVVISTGASLTLDPINGTISSLNGTPTGDLAKPGSALRGPAVQGANDNDSVTLQHGSTLVLTGASQKRIGTSSIGKPIVGFGTPGSEAVIKADANTYMTDAALEGNNNTMLVVSGTGSAGLRIEAPMNASYDSANNIYTSGLFGTNPDTSDTSVGSSYTVLSPNRYAGLSGFTEMPTVGADNQTITIGGTLTVAATDAAGATGVIDNGPAAPCAVTLALDNTATSGNLVYNIDPTVNPGTISNFAGLAIKRSNTFAGSVTAVVTAGTLTVSSLSVDPTAKLDVANNKLVVSNGTLGSWNGSNYDGITGLIKSGRNTGNWDGGGIITSMTAAKAASQLTTVAVALAGDVGYGGTQLFGGQSVNSADVLAMYTYAGDANLNGAITGDDYARIDAGFAAHATGYSNGDFNYDGKINADDYFLIDRNYSLQNSFSLSSADAQRGVGSSRADRRCNPNDGRPGGFAKAQAKSAYRNYPGLAAAATRRFLRVGVTKRNLGDTAI